MKKLIIIGGGFAGTLIAKKLENSFETVLIDNKDYFEYTPGILRTIVEPKILKKIQVLHNHYLFKTQIIKACIKKFNDNEIILDNNNKLKFDYLVIASGTSYSLPIKEDNIIKATRAKHLLEHHKKLQEAKIITVIGGGLVGVELASEIIEKYPEKNITIIQSGNRLMPRLNIKSTKYAQKFLEKKNVKIIFNERVTSVKDNNCITEKNTKIKFDLVFIATGVKPNSDFIDKKHLDDKGFVNVNDQLQIYNTKNIFAAGDIISIKEEKTAQNAEHHAKIIINNLKKLDNNHKDLSTYKSKNIVLVISLGKKKGILDYKSISIRGYFPAILKILIEWWYMRNYK